MVLVVLAVYAAGCAALYYYVVYPWFETIWDRTTTTSSAYFDGASYGYVFVCYLVYYFILSRLLGVQPINILTLITSAATQ